jgi:hypothetical protein
VLVRVELVAGLGVDLQHLVALERRHQLAQGGLGAFADLLERGLLDGQAGFQAVDHRQHVLGEAFDGELAGLGDLFLGAAAGVFGLGLGTQVLVGQFGALGLQSGQFGLGPGQQVRFRGCLGSDHLFGALVVGCGCWGGRVVCCQTCAWCRGRWGLSCAGATGHVVPVRRVSRP